MHLASPHKSLGMGVTGDVLAALASLRAPLSGRRIAERARVSASQAAKVLADLTGAGLVDVTNARPAILYELNRDHVLAAAVEAPAAARGEWRRRLATTVQTWDPAPIGVIVFGSAASGAATAGSDIDLLVVRPAGTAAADDMWSSQVAELARALRRWTGNGVDIVDATARELAANRKLHAEVHENGLLVAGELPVAAASSRRR